MFNEGVFRASFGATATPTQIFTEPLPDAPGGLGIRYQIATAKLDSGKTRIYLGHGSNRLGPFPYTDASKVLRTDDANAAAVQWTHLSSNVRGSQAYSTWDFCRDQCSYDMPIASPPGRPDEVWVGGVTQYQELPTRGGQDRNMSNGRALMRSVDAGATWTDMSGEAEPWPDWDALHPDLHELHFAPGGIAFVGSDGGVTRTTGSYVDFSSECDNPFRDLASRPLQLQMCRMWLRSIPERLVVMNAGMPTLQFQAIAVDQNDPDDILGGTQDNGSPGLTNGRWELNVRGDGGPPAIDRNGVTRYHAYTNTFYDVNFEGNVQGSWLWISDPMLFSPEASSFYAPLEADPRVSETAFAGMQHVWRTKTAGNADKQFLVDHCNTDVGDRAGTGSELGLRRLGADRRRGRRPQRRARMRQGRRRGRLRGRDRARAVEHVDDVGRYAARTHLRLPQRGRGACVGRDVHADRHGRHSRGGSRAGSRSTRTIRTTRSSRSPGYDAYTPATPGHVFEVRFNPVTGTATWTNLSYDLGDQPVTDVEYDAKTGDLYASTDFGVSRLVRGTAVVGRDRRRSAAGRRLPARARRQRLRPAALRSDARSRRVAGGAAAHEVVLPRSRGARATGPLVISRRAAVISESQTQKSLQIGY